MKQKPSLYLTVLIFILLSSAECRKHKPINPVDQLPPETHTGAGTIGFLANGQAFTSTYPNVYATYIFTAQDGYSLGINAKNQNVWKLIISTDSLKVGSDGTYSLNNEWFVPFTASGYYYKSGKEFFTKPYLQGELFISHLDSTKQIISGTFWFDAVYTINNNLLHVTDGRFDLHYTR